MPLPMGIRAASLAIWQRNNYVDFIDDNNLAGIQKHLE